MNKLFTTLALAVAICWPTAVFAASDRDVPARGMSKAEVRARFGEPTRARPAVGQPPISRWDYDGFSVYFENDTTLHSVRDQDRAAQDRQPEVDSDPEAEMGLSPANGEEPPTTVEEQETNVEVETFEPPSNEERDEDSESSSESQSAPGSTAVRAKADGGEDQTEESQGIEEGSNEAGDESTEQNSDDRGADADQGRFRFDPVTGRIVVSEDDEDEAAGSEDR